MTKYENLTNDLKSAVYKAEEFASNSNDDGGTCNFDTLALKLPRYNEKETLKAIESAGTRAYKTSWCGEYFFFISNPVIAQGTKRTAQAEIMANYMRDKGYDAYVYYQMD